LDEVAARVDRGERLGDLDSQMVDVTQLSLVELRAMGDSALAHCVRRLLAEVDVSAEPVAGFNSSI
jgi:FXSXX-COOH protein